MSAKDLFKKECNCPYGLEEFNYDLPRELIAQEPLPERGTSRLLVASRKNGSIEDRSFNEVIRLLTPGDVLVLNNTKVIPARLRGKKMTGGKVDVLIVDRLKKSPINEWRILVQPALRPGQEIVFGANEARARVVGREGEGYIVVDFGSTPVEELMRQEGSMPLPPYIRRSPDKQDALHYQTVYAQQEGAIAAPTAGLHFTDRLLEQIRNKGIQVCFLTLHVGYGTFKPVRDIVSHQMHSESFELPGPTARTINAAREHGSRVWAVGTTVVRVLETCAVKGRLISGSGQTDLFMLPPARFEIVDGLLTNFHLPQSTLFMLVSAFFGLERTKNLYTHAIRERYRFYSYGDAMLII